MANDFKPDLEQPSSGVLDTPLVSLQFNPAWKEIILAALSLMEKPSIYAVTADYDEIEAGLLYLTQLVADAKELKMIPLGVPFPYMTALPPEGCLPCDGAFYFASEYPDLFALLDDVFKTETQFFLPDLRGRTIVGFGGVANGFEDYPLAYPFGEEKNLLSYYNLPPHGHAEVQSNGLLANISTASPNRWIGDAPFNTTTGITPPDDEQTAHNNMQPSFTLKYAVRVE